MVYACVCAICTSRQTAFIGVYLYLYYHYCFLLCKRRKTAAAKQINNNKAKHMYDCAIAYLFTHIYLFIYSHNVLPLYILCRIVQYSCAVCTILYGRTRIPICVAFTNRRPILLYHRFRSTNKIATTTVEATKNMYTHNQGIRIFIIDFLSAVMRVIIIVIIISSHR